MILTLIAAHDPNLVIGKDGELPWHYPEDLKFFKQTTMGHTLLMGRIVFEELGEKLLPGREGVVLSRSQSYPHVPTFSSIDDALNHLSDKERVFVIGGGEIYRQTINMADELIITEIDEAYDGDTFFPEYRDQIGEVWKEKFRQESGSLTFLKYVRNRS
ncbi:dihydrofolate reductase [Rhodohalobacter sp. SW132]|uniref:dihydrofolate reductase n=1 Tax=Rhodohalobacter sp. SW132 TaxID=2293433 RepID=UPI000E23D88C|nr:dihydrofolate reductase [Rhodohalobacter sp. SW132]REL33662.1 dihydrofolate reductase [Rhodohalobacter sp. SW132]